MFNRCAHWTACASALALLSCGPKSTESSLCIDSDPACGIACNEDHPCKAGLHCGPDGLCDKQCTEDRGCSSDQHCSEAGACLPGAPTPPPPVTPMTDAGSVDNPGLLKDSGSTTGPMSGTGAVGPGECQRADVASTRVIPTVVLVIDQSGSMTEKFGSGTRWNVLRDFLLKPDGLIASFETQVRFGIAMYSATDQQLDDGGTPQCPMVTSVAPKLMNYSAISAEYKKAMPLDDTPTGDSIDQIVGDLPMAAPDQEDGPVVLVLATDGEPDRCEELNPQRGQDEAIGAVTRAFTKGIRTFIISVGNEVSTKHQQDMANAGVGHKAGEPNAPYWTAGDDATLRDALTQIIGGQVSCDVMLKGTVQGGDPCDGTVTLSGVPLVCKDKDGWELVDGTHIRLLGKACNDFKTQKTALVHASFPCSVQVVF